VGIEGIAATTTGDSGGYFLPNLPAGTYTVKVQMPGYVEAHREGVTVVVGLDLVLPQVTLRGGDVNGDCDVNLFDLIILSSSYGNPGHDPRADINGDGFVDLRDIVLVSSNLGRRCPGDWGP
jgi:hypothetical protein